MPRCCYTQVKSVLGCAYNSPYLLAASAPWSRVSQKVSHRGRHQRAAFGLGFTLSAMRSTSDKACAVALLALAARLHITQTHARACMFGSG